ncbi:hypothetical protein H7347_01915 [Corynebacterium sp. zg-331]|uniref:sensor histidine kinase n=1 Tax=unclassified Corynebacterium TaxID=2624378 RepID=UPI00128C552A|nr:MULTISPECIES: histidine kinase [unclassified Corynebacterium]MBC3185343.1 hypothetical protein [Corynebacterium sp. zg-331]MPV51840.1 hypothetical protein [Corynebacterium sp. zg331]
MKFLKRVWPTRWVGHPLRVLLIILVGSAFAEIFTRNGFIYGAVCLSTFFAIIFVPILAGRASAVICAHLILLAVLGYPYPTAVYIIFIFMYAGYISAVLSSSKNSKIWLLVIVSICLLWNFFSFEESFFWVLGRAAVAILPTSLVWLVGFSMKQRRENLLLMRERAELTGILERNRIAREMHDIIAHNLSGVIALADGARYSAVRDPQVAVDTLEVISETSRDALNQIRGLLSVLRDEEGRDRHSAPGITDILALVSDARRNGLELMVTGLDSLPDDLPPLLQFTLYRTVQELLTNMLKYSSTRTGSIKVEVSGRTIAIYSRNPTEGEPSSGGFGLMGMRERLQSQGGTLEAERKGGDFLVKAQVAA